MPHTPCVSVQAGSAFAAAGISINDTLHNGSLLIATATLTRAPRLVLDHPRVEHACKHRAPRTVSLIIYTYQKCVQCVPIQPCSGAVRRYRTRRLLGRAAQLLPLIFYTLHMHGVSHRDGRDCGCSHPLCVCRAVSTIHTRYTHGVSQREGTSFPSQRSDTE